jgi:hypothetical protein
MSTVSKPGIHFGSPETSGRCKAVYDFLLARGSVGATSIELATAEGRRQVAVGTTVSELRHWAPRAGHPEYTFPCRYDGLVDGCKVFRYWLRDYDAEKPEPVITADPSGQLGLVLA